MNKLRRTLCFGLLGSVPGISWVKSLLFPRAEAKRAEIMPGGAVDSTLESNFAALIDAFVPADETPGAIDLGIEQSILNRIRENREYLSEIVQMLERLNALMLKRFGLRFDEAALAQRTDIVLAFLTNGAQHKEDGILISSLRTRTLSAFYSSEAAFGMLDYHPPSQGGYPDYDRALL